MLINIFEMYKTWFAAFQYDKTIQFDCGYSSNYRVVAITMNKL